MSDFEFTDFDARMLHVMDRLEKVQAYLTKYGIWFCAEWERFSDEPPPFFGYAVQDLGDDRWNVRWVLILDEFVCDKTDFDPDEYQ